MKTNLLIYIHLGFLTAEDGLGYRLAGVDVIQVVEGDDFVEIMNKALKTGDLGVLAVEDAILNKLPESFVKRI